MRVGIALTCVIGLVGCGSVEQERSDTEAAQRLAHWFTAGGYSILHGGWKYAHNGRIVTHSSFPDGVVLRFDMNSNSLTTYARPVPPGGVIPAPAGGPGTSSSGVAVGTAMGLAYQIGLWVGYFAQTAGNRLDKVTRGLQIVTNRNPIWNPFGPASGPNWNTFVEQYCGGFQEPKNGFVWIVNGSQINKACLRLMKGGTATLDMRVLVQVPSGGSTYDTVVTPWMHFTK